MLSSFAWILPISLLAIQCAGSDDKEPDIKQVQTALHGTQSNDMAAALEEDTAKPESNSPVLDAAFLEKGCKEFGSRSMNAMKLSGTDSFIKLKDENSGLHLKLAMLEAEATIEIAPTPLQDSLQRLCISIPEHVSIVKIKLDTKVNQLVIRSKGHAPRVDIDTGDHGVLEKLRAESSGEAPKFFLKGLGVRPCRTPSDAYFCE